MIVVMAAAWYVGGAVGAGTFYGNLAAGATMIGGSLLVNQLIPLPQPSMPTAAKAANAHAISGASNQARPYGAVPRVYGKHRIYPPFAAKPYVLTVGGEQYIYLL